MLGNELVAMAFSGLNFLIPKTCFIDETLFLKMSIDPTSLKRYEGRFDMKGSGFGTDKN